MGWVFFSKARYTIGVGFEILARTTKLKLPPPPPPPPPRRFHVYLLRLSKVKRCLNKNGGHLKPRGTIVETLQMYSMDRQTFLQSDISFDSYNKTNPNRTVIPINHHNYPTFYLPIYQKAEI